MHSLPDYQQPYQGGTCAAIDEPTLTRHNHPKSLVYVRVFYAAMKILWYECRHIYRTDPTFHNCAVLWLLGEWLLIYCMPNTVWITGTS